MGIAGKLLFKTLKKNVELSKQRNRNENDIIFKKINRRRNNDNNNDNNHLSIKTINDHRLLFLKVAGSLQQQQQQQRTQTQMQKQTNNNKQEEEEDEEADALTIPIVNLIQCGFITEATKLLHFDDNMDVINKIDPKNTGFVTYKRLVLGLQDCTEESCSIRDDDDDDDRCDTNELLQLLMKRIKSNAIKIINNNENDDGNKLNLTGKRLQYSNKYDEMVKSFRNWKDYVPSDEGRLLDVLRGCFIGAENKFVVEALRIVYVDYTPLRLAGNTIFALMKRLIKSSSSSSSS